MSVGSRIKELREDKEMSRSELADKIGVTIGAVSNYENEVSSPKEPILFKIMEVLECDANYLFQDSINMPSMKNTFSVFEHNLIKKYRELDDHGKDMVDTVLQKEFDRIVVQDVEPKANIFTVNTDDMVPKASVADVSVDDGASNIIDVIRDTDDIVEDEYPAPNAANDRKATSKQKAHADNIMKNDSEWI